MLELRIRADKTGDPPEDGGRWPLSHVEIVGDAPLLHNFADSFVGKAMADGYLEFEGMAAAVTEGYSRNPVITGDVIVLRLATGDLRYEVIEHPGRYGDEVHHEYRCRLAPRAKVKPKPGEED